MNSLLYRVSLLIAPLSAAAVGFLALPQRAQAQVEPDMRGNRHFADGMVTTGAGWQSTSGRIARKVVDIAVPGSVGAYPLTVTRTMRNWVTNSTTNPTLPYWNQEAGCNSHWAFNLDGYAVSIVDYGYTGNQGVFLQYPDGTADRYKNTNTSPGVYTFGMGDRVYVDANKKVTLLKLADGGEVHFIDLNDPNQRYWSMSYMTDPHGLTYTRSVTTNAQGQVQETMTDASGRWVRLTYMSNANGNWPIRADSSNGNYVTYTWDFSSPTGLHVPVDTSKLTEADYADGTVATYQYTSNVHGVFPFRCYDTRATTRMHSVEYAFDMNRSYWNDVYSKSYLALFPLLNERLPYATAPLSSRSEFGVGDPNGHGVIETRGDGATREFVPRSAYLDTSQYAGRIEWETHGCLIRSH